MTENERADRFRRLHTQTYPDLLRFVERRVPPSEAEDIVSQVYLTAWRRFGELSEDARPWLFAVARRTMANQTRGWLRRKALDVRIASAEEPVAGDHAGDTAARVDLERAWRSLSAADRETLSLVLFDGLTSEQAATVAGCRPSTFAMRLSRARARLLASLETAPAPSFVSAVLREQS